MITVKNIHWIAGFLEGEGCFCTQPFVVQATQKDPEILYKLQILLNGMGKIYKHSNNDIHRWYIGNIHAASLMMTLYPLMSTKRQCEIKKALISWKSRQIDNRHKTHCPNGHLYNRTRIKRGKVIRDCTICTTKQNTEWKRKHRSKDQ